jgi:hypothetical protein
MEAAIGVCPFTAPSPLADVKGQSPRCGAGKFCSVRNTRIFRIINRFAPVANSDVGVARNYGIDTVYELLPGGKRFVRRGIAKAPDGRSREYGR